MQPPRPAFRVLVADDTALGAALEAALTEDPDLRCVARVADPTRVAEEAGRHRAEVILLGHLGGGSVSLQILGELVPRVPAARVLVLSEVASDIVARESLRRGAIGFLVHSGDLGTLLPRIRACTGQLPVERGADALA